MASNKMDLALWAKEFALKNGAEQVKISIANEQKVSIEYRDKKVDKLLESTSNTFNIEIFAEQKYSGQSTNDLRKPELEKFISEAIIATKLLGKDEFRKITDPRFYKKLNIDLKILDKNHDLIDSTKKVDLAQRIEKVAKVQSDRIISTTGFYSDGHYNSIKVHSNGFEGFEEGTYYNIGASVSMLDPNGSRPEDGHWIGSCFFNKLIEPEMVAIEAYRKTLKRIGQAKIASGKYDLIIKNDAARRLVAMLINPMNGSSVQQKRSFLDGKLGQKLFSDKLTIVDDPLIESSFGARLYDNDGIYSQKRTMVENGILKNFYIDFYYGNKLGKEPTSGSTSNLTFSLGKRSLDEIIKNTKKGILVDTFNGGNSNSTTGDFSYGVGGMLIENGQLVKPVNEMIVSGNALSFWSALSEVGNDPYPYSSWLTPSMLFKDIDFSGL